MLKIKIACNGIKPLKSAVYLLAAELVETDGLRYFSGAVNSALRSFDFFGKSHSEFWDNYENDYYEYYADRYCYLTQKEKVIALLFLSAMYAAKGEGIMVESFTTDEWRNALLELFSLRDSGLIDFETYRMQRGLLSYLTDLRSW